MFKSLKRVLATATTAALLVSNVGVAFAQTFKDVPTDAWYFDYVEQLVNDGVIEAGNTFNPAGTVNRAEMAKLVVTAVDGMADYEAPATPTFDDVPKSAPNFDYIEAAVQLGILAGYTDSKGNLTGKFGPGDNLNRDAAAKIIVNAFSIPTTLEPASIFSDVKEGAWYYDYVVSAYNQSVLNGYKDAAGNMTGKFGPADKLNRAQVAKLIVDAQNPVERVAPAGEGEGVTPPPAGAKGALEVSLNDMTAASSTLPQNASSVKLASFDFTAADSDVTVSSLVLTRGGVGKAGDWDALYLYEGAARLTTGRTVNNDTNTVTFSTAFTVDAGTTKTLTLVGDVVLAPGASNQHYFYISDAAAVTTGAKSVAGDFPVAGNTFTMGGNATVVNTVTVTTGSAISQPTIGQLNAEVASFKLKAGSTNDISVHSIALTQNGSLASSKLKNLKLLRGTDEVATAAGFVSERATFVLTTPYIIPKGQTKSFYVHADVDGGRTTDSVQLYLDENTDLTVIDQQYGYGAVVSNLCNAANPNGLKPANAPCVGVAATALKGGTLTISDNGPSAKQIAQNTTNVQLLNYSVTAGRDLTVKNMDLTIDLSTAGTAGTRPNVGLTAAALGADTVDVTPGTTSFACFVTAAAAGDVAGFAVNDMISMPTANGTVYAIITGLAGGACAGTGTVLATNNTAATALTAGGAITEINPYSLIKNVKVVDLDSGSTLQGPMTKASDGTVSGAATSNYMKTMPEDYELVGGEARHLSVQADIDQTMAAGYKLFASISYNGAGYVKDMAANENVAAADIVGGVLAGKKMSTAANSLAVTRASTPTSNTFVKGDDKVSSLGMAFTAGDAGEILIKKLNVRVYGNVAAATPWANAAGDTAANTLVSSVTLYDGNDVVDGPRTLTLVDTGAAGFVANTGDYYKVLFDNLSLKVAKGSTKTLTAKVKLLNSQAVTSYLALDMLPSADITAEDADANTITATDPAGVGLNAAAAHLPLMTILTSGSLSVSSEGNPDAKNLVAGSTMQLVSKYRFATLNEAFNVNKLTVINDTDGGVFGNIAPGDTNAVSQIALKYTDMNGVSQTKTGSLSGGSATLSDMGFFVPAGGESFVEIYANINDKVAVGESISGKTFRLGVRDTGNTVSTFEAVGASSSTTLNATGVGADVVPFTNPASVNGFVVRKSVPTFTKASGLSTSLVAAEMDLFGLTVTADALGAVSFGRLSFTVTNGAGGNLGQFKLYRGSSPWSEGLLTATKAFIYRDVIGAGAGADAAANAAIMAGGATADIIASFIQPETVGAGSSTTYYLKATRDTVAGGSESIQTKLAIDDENVPVVGITGVGCSGAGTAFNGNANTGRIVDSLAACGLFGGGVAAFATRTYTMAEATGTCVAGEITTATINGTAVSYTATIADCAGADAADVDAVMTGLNAAINANATVSALVTSTVVTAGANATITLTAKVAGTIANAYTTTAGTTSAVQILVATGATMAGGVDDSSFVTTMLAGRSIIWSDKSANTQGYITGLGANDILVNPGSGSYDWTNGYLLKTTAVAAHSVSK